MRVLGIDCGGEFTGYGVVEQDDRFPSSLLQRSDSSIATRCTGTPSQEDLRKADRDHRPAFTRAGRHRRRLLCRQREVGAQARTCSRRGHAGSGAGWVGGRGLFPALDQVRGRRLRQSREIASADHGRAPAGSTRAARVCRCRRRSRHRDLPSAYRRHIAAATGGSR